MRVVEDSDSIIYTAGEGVLIEGAIISIDTTQVALADHNHNELYADINHKHDDVYAAVDHTHSVEDIDDFPSPLVAATDGGILIDNNQISVDADKVASKEHTHSVADILDLDIPEFPDVSSDSTSIHANSTELVTGGAIYAKYGDGGGSSSGPTQDTNSWRPVYIDSTEVLDSDTDASLIFQGSNGITIKNSSNVITISYSGTSVTYIEDLKNVSASAVATGSVLVYTEIKDQATSQTSYNWSARSLRVSELETLSSPVTGGLIYCIDNGSNSGTESYGYASIDANTLEIVQLQLTDPPVLRVKSSISPGSSIPPATTSSLGGIIVGDGLEITDAGKLSVSGSSGGGGSGGGTTIPEHYLEIDISINSTLYTPILPLNSGDKVCGWLFCIPTSSDAVNNNTIAVYATDSGICLHDYWDTEGPKFNVAVNDGHLSIVPTYETDKYGNYKDYSEYSWKIGFVYTIYRASSNSSSGT